MSVLKIENLAINFGGLKAVEGVNLKVTSGQIVGLIGPNGAGKTTIFNLLTGVYVPTEGDILLAGKSVVGMKTSQINNMGIARTFQNIRLFGDMTVMDNVKTAMNKNMDYNIVEGILHLPAYWREERLINMHTYRFLKVMGLDAHVNSLAKNLPYGLQRRLEIARALATNPRILLLDEPAAGMNPTETKELLDIISDIRDKFDLSILLIEHDMNFVMGICEYIYVLDYGRIIASGTPEEVRNDPKVIEAYLGGE